MIRTMAIRRLHGEDLELFKDMDTGIEDDYVLRVFDQLTEGNNRLFGLFINDQIAVIGGFTLFKKRYAMLGRLRTDRRFRGQNLATELNRYLIKEAFHIDGIDWVGANTQEDNFPAKRVLKKLGLTPLTALHGAWTDNLSSLSNDQEQWQEVYNKDEKKDWIQGAIIDTNYIFPYACYYPFPTSWELFNGDELDHWRFFENKQRTRFFILKTDQKKHHYLHLVYPWNDLHLQTGIWETTQSVYEDIVKENPNEQTYIWVDLTKEAASQLPKNHSFTLPSPWVLHGITKEKWERMN